MKENPTVLLVDDSKTVQLVLRKYLRQIYREKNQRCEVLDAIDGQDALSNVTYWETIDLIFTDLDMPRMAGFEFIEEVRKRPDTDHIPIVVITTQTATENMQKAKSLGVNDFFVKPFTEQDLRALLARL